MRVKKAISEVVFSLLAFSREWKFGAVISGSYPSPVSLNVVHFIFIHRKNPVNGRGLHWIQPQCADAYYKLPSMVGSQPIICFLILDCNKYSQVGSSLGHWIFAI